MISRVLAQQIKQRGANALPSASIAKRVLASNMCTWPQHDNKFTSNLIAEISEQRTESVKTVVPWFLKNLPPIYFNRVPEELRKQHLKAVAAIHDLTKSDMSLKVETLGEKGSMQLTYINTESKTGLTLEHINNLVVPADSVLSRVQVFASDDHQLSLNIFFFESNLNAKEVATANDAKPIFDMAADIRAGKHAGDNYYPKDCELFTEASLNEYLTHCTPSYCELGNPRRFLTQRQMYAQVSNTDKAVVHIEQAEEDANGSWITLAAANVLPEVLLRLSANMLAARGLNINRSHLDTVDDPENSTPEIPGFVTMLRLLVDSNVTKNGEDYVNSLKKDLKRAKWYDDHTVQLGMVLHPEVGIDRAEVTTALTSMLHGPLSKTSSSFASIKSIQQSLDTPNRVLKACAISQWFLDKFNPKNPLTDAQNIEREAQLRDSIATLNVAQGNSRVVLEKMIDAVKLTLRTNFYNEDRYALSLRVDPRIMATGGMGEPEFPHRPLPYGVFFAHGRHFNAFHCRFRDVARGGLRVVTPANSDVYASESSRHFDEVYGLSYAQQLKNKDIPEGGAKAVIVINTPNLRKEARFFAMRKSIRAFTDSVFDLMVKDSVVGLVDHLGTDELLYFGPDEQVIPSDCVWITQRAAQRGYPIPGAFMSSKPGPGFNHKVYGVTSEGVVVFLDVALRKSLGIDPTKQPFTVKITGGPDGDVAGNLMKILIRDYGSNAKIVGVADGFGVAEDPNGLNHEEIMRLFNEGHPINQFDTAKLSGDGIMMDASTEEGAARRNSMVFRVKADAFVPGGGRPNTLNKDNWEGFLDKDGVPSAPLIVEGANLFNTTEARKHFHESGISVVKDSSANKCGVMTSSYEVQSSMLLSTEEFMENKDALVDDVLVKLRVAARSEAELMFKSYHNYPGTMPEFSERISNAINKVTDALLHYLQDIPASDPRHQELMPLIKENLPTKLADLAWDRVPSRFPVQYQRCVISSTLASKLVYQEGIHLIESQPNDRIAQRAIDYYLEDTNVKHLVKDLEGRDLGMSGDEKKKILDLLNRGGARTSMGVF